tara:strand:+ start:1105 stop:2517 length:1413 start_codon:yes stop_codon:yes gene_type:complete
MSVPEQINKIYEKRGYLQNYGGDIILALCISIVLIGINVYFYILNHLAGLKQQWNAEVNPINCKPLYIPFASVINPPADGKDLAYIETNAKKCATQSLSFLGRLMVDPIKTILDEMVLVLVGVADTLKDVLESIEKIVDSITTLLSSLTNLLSINIDTNNTLFSNMTNAVKRFMTINTVVAYVVQGFTDFGMSLIMSIDPALCFDKHTMLVMADGSIKSIYRLSIGDRLQRDGCVTSIMKLTSKNVDMYNYKDIIVSGKHVVYEEGKYIKVENSKKSIFIPNYENKDIWCITTASKQIHINDTIFCDYDDLTIEDCSYLKQWIYNRYQKDTMSNYDIHRHMNGGLIDTPIKMQNGTYKTISTIDVDDILYPNVKVCGKVEILPTHMKVRTVNINGHSITGGTNIQILDKRIKTSFNLMDCAEPYRYTHKPLYHLITDKGGFYVNHVFIGDYSMNMALFFKEDRQSILSVI